MIDTDLFVIVSVVLVNVIRVVIDVHRIPNPVTALRVVQDDVMDGSKAVGTAMRMSSTPDYFVLKVSRPENLVQYMLQVMT